MAVDDVAVCVCVMAVWDDRGAVQRGGAGLFGHGALVCLCIQGKGVKCIAAQSGWCKPPQQLGSADKCFLYFADGGNVVPGKHHKCGG